MAGFLAALRFRVRKNHARPPTTAMASRPQATPMPAAAPVLRPDELLFDTTAGAVALGVDDVEAAVNVETVLDELVVAAVLELNVDDVLVVTAPTVVVSNRSRWSLTVSPKLASGWLLHAVCMASRTTTVNLCSDSVSFKLTVSQHHRSSHGLQT